MISTVYGYDIVFFYITRDCPILIISLQRLQNHGFDVYAYRHQKHLLVKKKLVFVDRALSVAQIDIHILTGTLFFFKKFLAIRYLWSLHEFMAFRAI